MPVLNFDLNKYLDRHRVVTVIVFVFRQGKTFDLCIVYDVDSHIKYSMAENFRWTKISPSPATFVLQK